MIRATSRKKEITLSSKPVSSVSAASASADEEYYSTFNPIRTGGMMPKSKAIAPQSVKNVSPTPSQTQVTSSFSFLHHWSVSVCVWVYG